MSAQQKGEDERLWQPFEDTSDTETRTEWGILRPGDTWVREVYMGEDHARQYLREGDTLVCCTIEIETRKSYSDYRVVAR